MNQQEPVLRPEEGERRHRDDSRFEDERDSIQPQRRLRQEDDQRREQPGERNDRNPRQDVANAKHGVENVKRDGGRPAMVPQQPEAKVLCTRPALHPA